MPLAVGNVEVNPQDMDFAYSGWFYFTMVLIGLLVLMAFIGTAFYQKKRESWGAVAKVVQSFNLKESVKIFKYKQSYLNVFNGIKTICMMWVVMGHLFSIRLQNNVNVAGISSKVEEPFFLWITAAFLSVDVFFWIGGFLVAYSFMREKSKSILKYPIAIVHRVLRFWPSYTMTILLYYAVYIHTSSGPLWPVNLTLGQVPNCGEAWKTLLFVDNLVDNG